jgi:phytoene dehydrogenase-like protein
VVGAGPNGLTAAITLARAGASVLLLEGAENIGGGARSAELTLPRFVHDVCSAIHPLAVVSPALRDLDLHDFGLEYTYPEFPFAHPFDDGSAAVVERSVERTAERLGVDGPTYRKLLDKPVDAAESLVDELLRPLRVPRHPLPLVRFGLRSIRSAEGLASSKFKEPMARGLLAGVAAHSMLPLDRPPTAGFALMLILLAHAVGWPAARGGSQRLSDALAARLRSHGGEIQVDRSVRTMSDLPPHRIAFFDVTPRQLTGIAGDQLPHRYVRALRRYRYGPGVFKIDWALDGPIPWRAQEISRAGTVHIGGTLEEIASSEAAVTSGRIPERPYVLAAQQSMFDPSRAPEGKHTLWAYCHVPHGSDADMTDRIEGQVERFAPGFRDLIIGRHVLNAAAIEKYNPNYVGGDINGGIQDLRQHLARPVARRVPYTTPNPSIYICSSSTPPGGGVHGLCGYFAAKVALRRGLEKALARDRALPSKLSTD